jgi:AcrR family transcriptional regulator
MANVKNNSATQETRRRLLRAAGEVFAQRGFHAATIKHITDRAGASLASVNYHFRDKSELYAAVLRHIACDALQIIPPDDQLVGNPRRRFREFIRLYCLRLLGREQPDWEQIVIAREMVEPTAALDSLLSEVFKPLNEKLSNIIAELLAVDPTDESVGLVAASVFGQCIYYLRNRQVMGRMYPQLGHNPNLERVATHIANFSLAGLASRTLKKSNHRRRTKQVS